MSIEQMMHQAMPVHTTRSNKVVGKINLNPGRPALDAADLDALCELYLAKMENCVLPVTLLGYRNLLGVFRRWWAETGPPRDWKLTQEDLREFERWLRVQPSRYGKPLSFHARNDVLRRLRQLFHWAAEHGHTEQRNYATWVPPADGEAPKRTAATLAQLRRLFEAAAASPTPIRDQAILAIFIGTGIRRVEARNLRIEAIDFYADGSGVAKVIGKRTKANKSGEREFAFDVATGAYLRAYINERGVAEGTLFVGLKGPLTVQSIYRVVKNALRTAELTDVIQACHDLRRTFATHMSRQYRGEGYGDLLRRQLGHASYKMTSSYTLLDATDIRDAFVSPLAQIVGPEGYPVFISG